MTMSLRRHGAALALASTLACFAHPLTGPAFDFPGAVDVPLARFRSDGATFSDNSGFTQPARLVVRDAAAWRDAWATIWQGYGTVPPLPAVDFSREIVLVAALGQRPSGGYSILVDSAATRDGELFVRVRSIAPGARCGTTTALTSPVDVVRVPVRVIVPAWIEYSVATDCP